MPREQNAQGAINIHERDSFKHNKHQKTSAKNNNQNQIRPHINQFDNNL